MLASTRPRGAATTPKAFPGDDLPGYRHASHCSRSLFLIDAYESYPPTTVPAQQEGSLRASLNRGDDGTGSR